MRKDNEMQSSIETLVYQNDQIELYSSDITKGITDHCKQENSMGISLMDYCCYITKFKDSKRKEYTLFKQSNNQMVKVYSHVCSEDVICKIDALKLNIYYNRKDKGEKRKSKLFSKIK